MNLLLDAFWRAAAYCLHPRIVLWALAPLALTAVLAGLFGWFFWEGSIAAVRAWLDSWSLGAGALAWLDSVGASGMRALVAPLIVLALAVPLLVIVALLMVALSLAPSVVRLVAARRFPLLARRGQSSFLRSLLWSLGSTLLALLALIVSLPFWLIPPLVLLLPPLIWGWLSYRVMSYDALADHADAAERQAILREERLPLLIIGVVTGYLGAAPSLLWAFGAAAVILAPVLLVLSVWLYTLVFAFSCLWFTHYALAALSARRQAESARAAQEASPAGPGIDLPPAAAPAVTVPPPALPF